MADLALPLTEEVAVPAPTQGGDTFPELVWAHWRWERDVHGRDGAVDPKVEAEYRAALAGFERRHGEIYEAYWSTRKASAVAVTVKRSSRPWCWLGRDPHLRFHHATDWVTKESPPIAGGIQECESLAIRVSEVLRGTSQRVAMQQILSVASHLLGFLDGTKDQAGAQAVAMAQKGELHEIEGYYERAGSNAGRIVYFWGMMTGILALVLLAPALLAPVFFDDISVREMRSLFVCYIAGALGALVSVLSRMNKGAAFSIDFEVGRPALRRLGSFRPVLGAVFGVLTYFVLAAGIVPLSFESGDLNADTKRFFYYGALAFVAGFSERWTKILLGTVERQIPGGGGEDDSNKRRQSMA